jgi:hypothetical protein
MFKLNFKELLTNEISSVVNTQLQKNTEAQTNPKSELEPENASVKHTKEYYELVELINKISKKEIKTQTQKAVPLFSTKSVITILAFLISSIYVQVDAALVDNNFSHNEMFEVFVTLVGAAAAVTARGAEGKAGVYTAHSLPGLNKEDYYTVETLEPTKDEYLD